MKQHIILTTVFLLILGSVSYSQLNIRDTTVKWSHFQYELDPDHSISNYSQSEISEVEFQGLVLENKYIRLTLVPEFGGRVISCIYKPTGHEQLYTNPNGIPYGIGEGNFYYNWLMVYGGIFATFPEPEHGKTWLLPWKSEIIKQTADTISVAMTIKDTIEYSAHDGRFNNGITEMECGVIVSIYKGRSNFSLDIALENTRNTEVRYEYWTCTTLSPGSPMGQPGCYEGTEMVVPTEYVKLKDDWWSWMRSSETPYNQNDHLFYYNNLSDYENWENMGIAYAYPGIESNYWGVINHSEQEGIFRIADNKNFTPGMKFWTWGFEQGTSANPMNFNNGGNGPYIELWAGHSSEFFQDALLAPLSSKKWIEHYLITSALDDFTSMNENAATNLAFAGLNEYNEFEFSASVFSALPEQEMNVEINLEGAMDYNLFNGSFYQDPVDAFTENISLSPAEVDPGEYIYSLRLKDQEGQLLLNAEKIVQIESVGSSINNRNPDPDMILSFIDNQLQIRTVLENEYLLEIFNVSGQLIKQDRFNGNIYNVNLNPGQLYLVRLSGNGSVYTDKILAR